MTHDEDSRPFTPDRALRARFIAIVLIEAAVLAGLWAFGWYFGR